MNHRSLILLAIVTSLAVVALAFVDTIRPNKKEGVQSHYILKGFIDLEGECWEDHVGQWDKYAGKVVRWQSANTGRILTYGFVSRPISATRVINEAQPPTAYYTPPMIKLSEINIDTEQAKWVVKGVSDRGENEQGYDSTCELEVLKRGTKLPDMPPVGLALPGNKG